MDVKLRFYIWSFIVVISIFSCSSEDIVDDDKMEENFKFLGLWSTADELKQIPMKGTAWEAVLDAANIDFSKPVIADNNSNDDVNCLAAAIFYARTGNKLYRDKVIAALEYNVANGNPGFDNNGILTWCRNV